MCLAHAAWATSTCSSGAPWESTCAETLRQIRPSWHGASEEKHSYTHTGNSKTCKVKQAFRFAHSTDILVARRAAAPCHSTRVFCNLWIEDVFPIGSERDMLWLITSAQLFPKCSPLGRCTAPFPPPPPSASSASHRAVRWVLDWAGVMNQGPKLSRPPARKTDC
eukprot:1156284-Pelagomonas_calceolata.AAC.8